MMTVKDIIDLIGDGAERVVVSYGCDPESWAVLPCDSPLFTEEILKATVENIGVHNGMIQIWMADKD